MSRSEPRGIIDPSVLRLREATVTAGVWLTYVLCATGGIYVALTWSRPHRALLATLFGVAALCGVAVARLPRARIVRSRLRELHEDGHGDRDRLQDLRHGRATACGADRVRARSRRTPVAGGR